MKKQFKLLFFSIIFATTSLSSYAEDKHDDHSSESKTQAKNKTGSDTDHSELDHKNEEETEHKDEDHKEEDGHKHVESEGEEKGHAHEEGGHEEEEAENSGVGPDKGILEKGALGFKLAPEAVKTFELEYRDIISSEIEVPRSTVVTIRDGKFLYGFKDDWIKRHPVTILSKTSEYFRVRLLNHESVGKIITKGVGFVRGAELIVEEGSASGHSH